MSLEVALGHLPVGHSDPGLGHQLAQLGGGALDRADAVVHPEDLTLAQELTARVLTAIRNPHVDVIAHPSGRMIGTRDDLDLDWDEVYRAAARTGTVLEMNGSLTISSVKGPDGKTALQFIQDRVNEFNVKVNLGQLYAAGSDITLTFDYAGALATPEGGPIADTRLAYIGPEGSYLFYAARWFPFHGYAADRATSDISFTVPANWSSLSSVTFPQLGPVEVRLLEGPPGAAWPARFRAC